MEINKTLASKRLARLRFTDENSSMVVQMISMREADYSDVTRKWNTKWHKHSFFELHATITGSCVYYFMDEEKPHLLERGQMLLIRPETLHRVMERSPDFIKGTAAFTMPLAMQKGRDAQEICALLNDKPYQILQGSDCFIDALDQILREVYDQQAGYHILISHLLQQTIIDIARRIPNNATLSKEPEEEIQDPRAQLILRHIKDNISFKITNTDLAAHVHVSTKQLDRIVMQAFDCTPQQLVAVVKCNMAKEWMHQDSTLSVQDVANRLGFSSEYSFSRCFKRVEGMPPGMYRRHFGP